MLLKKYELYITVLRLIKKEYFILFESHNVVADERFTPSVN
jgi:hypothetical protein